jgi:hypothetical protein
VNTSRKNIRKEGIKQKGTKETGLWNTVMMIDM